jgi:glycosyltransferase involved in cell wall biosynthesis
MRVAWFGTYSTGEGYPRNRVLIEGLRRNGVTVEEVNACFWRGAADKIAGMTGVRGGLGTAFRYARAWLRLVRLFARCGPHDVVVVGYTGQVDVFLARFLWAGSGRPVVLDAFLSLHDTLVRDRRLVREGSVAARLLRFLDRTSCRAADLVLLDTAAHADWFARFTGLPRERFFAVPVGEDDRVFPSAPLAPRGGPLRVLWFGTFVPLQGVGTILDAAERLAADPVRLRLVGRGQELPERRARAEVLPNVDLHADWMAPAELHNEIVRADVVLGIFGTGGKARRVVPCKVWDALAVGRPVITSDTPAAREVLADGESALLVPSGDPEALAAAVRRLGADEGLRRHLAAGGHACYLRHGSPEAAGRVLRDRLRALPCR